LGEAHPLIDVEALVQYEPREAGQLRRRHRPVGRKLNDSAQSPRYRVRRVSSHLGKRLASVHPPPSQRLQFGIAFRRKRVAYEIRKILTAKHEWGIRRVPPPPKSGGSGDAERFRDR